MVISTIKGSPLIAVGSSADTEEGFQLTGTVTQLISRWVNECIAEYGDRTGGGMVRPFDGTPARAWRNWSR